jgi:succinate dehydrogenase / fumarate reductase cytochrome b subunit
MAGHWNDKRPMAPHLQIWRWHPAMLSSILHRATSIICYVALIIVGLAMLNLALTGSLPLSNLIYSPLGAIGLFVFLFSFLFMALAQLRHLVWDKGIMMDPDSNNRMSYMMILFSLLGAGFLAAAISGAF